jgi:hypothetical protein
MPAGKLPDLAHAQPETRRREGGDAAGKAMRHMADRPDDDGDGVARRAPSASTMRPKLR